MQFLRAHLSHPRTGGESNYYLDLWSGKSLELLAETHGLTNNHALIVDSHGGAGSVRGRRQFQFWPHADLLSSGDGIPRYSIADFAAVLGAAQASEIHNILISACNVDGSFEAGEVRRSFPNATNIMHLPAGALGFKPMFYQALTRPATGIERLAETKHGATARGDWYWLERAPTGKNIRWVEPYVSELFLPGNLKPFQIVRAGKERLQPSME